MGELCYAVVWQRTAQCAAPSAFESGKHRAGRLRMWGKLTSPQSRTFQGLCGVPPDSTSCRHARDRQGQVGLAPLSSALGHATLILGSSVGELQHQQTVPLLPMCQPLQVRLFVAFLFLAALSRIYLAFMSSVPQSGNIVVTSSSSDMAAKNVLVIGNRVSERTTESLEYRSD